MCCGPFGAEIPSSPGPNRVVFGKKSPKLPAPGKGPRGGTKKPQREGVPQAAAGFPAALLWSIPWFHHVSLMEKVKDQAVRLRYMQQTLANGVTSVNYDLAELLARAEEPS